MAESSDTKFLLDRSEKFVTLSTSESLNQSNQHQLSPSSSTPTDDTSDKVYRRCLEALQMLSIWGPAYKNYMEKNYDDLMKVKTPNKLRVEKSKKDKELIGHFDTLMKMISSLQLGSIGSDAESGAANMVECINTRKYPMLYYYTSQSGMKYWFRKSFAGTYTAEEKRMIQFGDQNNYDRTKQRNIDYMTERLSDNETDVKQSVLFCYRAAVSGLSKFVAYELQNLDLDNSQARLTEGVIYRGENMSEKEFSDFKEKVNPGLLKAFFQPRRFTEGLCSTSTDRSVVKRFLGSADKFKRVIYSIHLVSPSDEELTEFYRLFPDVQLMCATLKIQDLSDFANEKEVMATSLYVLTMNSYPSESENIYEVECVLSPFYLYNGHSEQEKTLHAMDFKMAMLNLSSNSDSLFSHYKRYPHQMAINYLEYLNGMVANRFMFEYYRKAETRNDIRANWCQTLIVKCMEQMEKLKSYHSMMMMTSTSH